VRTTWIWTTSAAAALLLAGCGSGGTNGAAAGAGGAATGSASSSTPAASSVLATWQSPLGQIVIDGKGRTVYVFDKDSAGSGSSACTGTCASLWPAVTTTGAAPSVNGVSGTVGTIARADGSTQVTLDGHPLYTYSGDSASGQVTGQGFMGIWWVVSPSGSKVTGAAASSSAASSSAPGSAGGGSTY
jgi:predicted lipoprotein with Yx(FWY)xxD motif